MKKFVKSLLFPYPFLSVACWALMGVLLLHPLLMPTEKVYKNENGFIPDSQEARDLVKKCEATTGFDDSDFSSSWLFNTWAGDPTSFRCTIQEKIDYRERSRLEICAKNPVKAYSWEARIGW